MHPHRWSRSVVVVVASIALLAACGSSKSKVSATTDTIPSTTDKATTTTAAGPTTTRTGNFAAAKVKLTKLVEGLDSPVALSPRPHSSTLYVADQGGVIRAIADGKLTPTPVLDITKQVVSGGEQGLLGLTFSPDGTKLYVDYTDTKGDTNVDEYAMQGDAAQVSTKRRLLFVDQPYSNHNGGEVLTGPDGMLYVGFGDGGSAGDPHDNGQNRSVLLGKILRIDPDATPSGPYSAPANNPFVGQADLRPEIWQWGLRNPWRFSFDKATDDMWIGDVGQGMYEEIDFAKAGQGGLNFGWSQREGEHKYKGDRPAGAVDPVYEYTHDSGEAVTGGYVYRGTRIPDLYGTYVYADYSYAQLIGLQQKNGVVSAHKPLVQAQGAVSSFAEDNDGEIYVLDLIGGIVFRLDPA